ncbi:hypothetical protein P7K49_035951 [Saguinus oedipus]|uniref:Uncharacterized protein n=1 Tax=Saguinus oedipus TaxID=9490 RepID=A0ABQ9TPF5_SAGOE|nr:hypothetical protein P7K49_035951 [Saguinus oedipus]
MASTAQGCSSDACPGWSRRMHMVKVRREDTVTATKGGSAHDAEAPQGAEDVHDPDHRSVQVCLPSPHPVPPELQTHLIPLIQLLEEGLSSIPQEESHLQTTSAPATGVQVAGSKQAL